MKEKAERLPVKIAVRAIIINDEQKVMLIKRPANTFAGNKWCLVGGKLDQGESIKRAAAREASEEIGLRIPLQYYTQIENPDVSTGIRWVTHYFFTRSNSLPTQVEPQEVSEVAFFSKDELKSLDIAFDHKDVLNHFFNKLMSHKT